MSRNTHRYMTSAEKFLISAYNHPLPIIDNSFDIRSYLKLDLSVTNEDLSAIDITEPEQCQAYISNQLAKNKAEIAYGGYLEERNLYKNSPSFGQNGVEERNIHLGIDIWGPAETNVLAPLDGLIHSFQDNGAIGDYGPAIILEHRLKKQVFYTLYGHLSRESLEHLYPRKPIKQGEPFAKLGKPEENGCYAPHLHFQIILDLGSYSGDYPGVCSKSTLDYYKMNCPDPEILLKINS